MPRFPSSWDEPYRRPDEPQNLNSFARDTDSPSRFRPVDSGFPSPGEDPVSGQSAEVVSAVLSGAESSRQRELASRIYDRLKAGYDVDDLGSLIGELSQAATEQLQRSAFSGSISRVGNPLYRGSSSDSNSFKGYR